MQKIRNTNQMNKSAKSTKKPLTLFFILAFIVPILACGGGNDELELARLEATSQIVEITKIAAENEKLVLQMTAPAPQPSPIQDKIDSIPEPASPTSMVESTPEIGNVEPPPPTLAPTPEGILFFEDFSNNNNGWDLSARAEGATRLSNEQLLVTVKKNSIFWIIIPELEVENEFYVEAQMTYLEGQLCCSWIGWGIGNSNGNNHKFLASSNSYAYYDNNLRLFNTKDSTLFSHNTPVVIGLEFINGNAILYVNGEEKDIFSIQPYGKNIGIVIWNTNTYYGQRDNTVTIDNIIVREFR